MRLSGDYENAPRRSCDFRGRFLRLWRNYDGRRCDYDFPKSSIDYATIRREGFGCDALPEGTDGRRTNESRDGGNGSAIARNAHRREAVPAAGHWKRAGASATASTARKRARLGEFSRVLRFCVLGVKVGEESKTRTERK